MDKQSGLTIIEVTVVVVVISLIAAASALGIHQVRRNTQDSAAKSAAIGLQDAIEAYHKDSRHFPMPSGSPSCSTSTSTRVICSNSELSRLLVAKYIKEIPRNTDGSHIKYEAGVKLSSGDPDDYYALELKLNSGTCKVGRNIPSSVWSSVANCNF